MYKPDKKVLDKIAELELREYLLFFAISMDPNDNLEELTGLFSERPYMEKEVGGNIWRRLRPREKRFDCIDIVYNRERQVKCVRWFSSFELAQLTDIFGKPFLASSYPGEGEMTAFIFPSDNKHLLIGSLMPEYIDEDILDTDPSFNPKLRYVEFRIGDPDQNGEVDGFSRSPGNPGMILN